MNKQYQTWARQLLGADSWRNWAQIYGVLGWCMSGYARIVRLIAMSRARLWCLPQADLYRRAFDLGRANGGEHAWAYKSLCVIQKYGILDWPNRPLAKCEHKAKRRVYIALSLN